MMDNVEVQSEAGAGTVFRIALPIKQDKPEDDK
jgi:signal transduction histidine kinase